MHYYKRNIGDYHKKAGRLSILEHGAYTLLIDACYDREQFPTEQQAIEWTWARTEDEISAVRFVLSKFFHLQDGVYVQTRIHEEVSKYHENAITNKRIAIEREEKRKNSKERFSTNRAQSVDEPPPNQEPRTTNHKPVTKNQLDYSCWPQLPTQQTLDDWLAMRKRLKANVSQTVINRFSSELQKAVDCGYTVDACLQECVTRNWRGFEFQWILNSGVGYANIKQHFAQRDTRDKAARAADAAFGSDFDGILEGDFARIDPHGFIEQSKP
jgi:uncharacterized protein YdaU (DUF1376 family)